VYLVAGIGQVADPSKTGGRLFEYFQTLGHEFPIDCGEPGEVPAWPRQAIHEPDRDRFTHGGEDDGECCSRSLHGKGRGRVRRQYCAQRQPRQFGREGVERGFPLTLPSVLDRDILVFGPSVILKPIGERLVQPGVRRRGAGR